MYVCGFSGHWKIFNGNEIAAIFANYLWTKQSGPNRAMVRTHVSSRFLEQMARAEGFTCCSTETGFKNLANCALELKKQGFTVIMAYEEAIGSPLRFLRMQGYMIGEMVWDKDGLSALLLAYAIVLELYSRSATLGSYLDGIYQKYCLELDATLDMDSLASTTLTIFVALQHKSTTHIKRLDRS